MTDKKKSRDEPEKVGKVHLGIFGKKPLPMHPDLDIALSEIRNIMKREGLFLCCLGSDGRIYFVLYEEK